MPGGNTNMEGIRLALLTGIHLRTDTRPGEPEPGGAKLNILRLYKLEERWDGKGGSAEEHNVKLLEAGVIRRSASKYALTPPNRNR
jgi:hypothetical protein